jgi:hypothetical protein
MARSFPTEGTSGISLHRFRIRRKTRAYLKLEIDCGWLGRAFVRCLAEEVRIPTEAKPIAFPALMESKPRL